MDYPGFAPVLLEGLKEQGRQFEALVGRVEKMETIMRSSTEEYKDFGTGVESDVDVRSPAAQVGGTRGMRDRWMRVLRDIERGDCVCAEADDRIRRLEAELRDIHGMISAIAAA